MNEHVVRMVEDHIWRQASRRGKSMNDYVEQKVREHIEAERKRKGDLLEGSAQIMDTFKAILDRCKTTDDVQVVHDRLVNVIQSMESVRFAEIQNKEALEHLKEIWGRFQ